jgi:hypothetical protein
MSKIPIYKDPNKNKIGVVGASRKGIPVYNDPDSSGIDALASDSESAPVYYNPDPTNIPVVPNASSAPIYQDPDGVVETPDISDCIRTFLALYDTPTSYTGMGGMVVAVSRGENGLVFRTIENIANVQSDWLETDDENAAYIWNKPENLSDFNDDILDGFYSKIGHTHHEVDIIDLDKYTKAEVDALIAAVRGDLDDHIADTNNPHEVTYSQLPDKPTVFPPEDHTHTESEIVDLDKYSQAEVDNLLDEKMDTSVYDTNNNGYVDDADNQSSVPGALVSDALDNLYNQLNPPYLNGFTFVGHRRYLEVGAVISNLLFTWDLFGNSSGVKLTDSKGIMGTVLLASTVDNYQDDETYQMTSKTSVTWHITTQDGALSDSIITDWIYASYNGKNTTGNIPTENEIKAGSKHITPTSSTFTANPHTLPTEYGWFAVEDSQSRNYTEWYIAEDNYGAIGPLEFIRYGGQVNVDGRNYDLYIYNYPSEMDNNITLR